MIITKLIGGNGNQMFQYAAGYYFAKHNKTALLLDINYLLDKSKRYFRHDDRDYALGMFNISAKIATNKQISRFIVPRTGNKYIYHIKKRILPSYNVINEKDLPDMDSFNKCPSDCYIEGYWQNPFFFSEIENGLRQEFTFKNILSDSCIPVFNTIKNCNSVCVIFRRGDFVNHPFLDIVGLDFYYNALEVISDMISLPKLFIFSDDIPWCEANFKPHNFDYEFVDQKLTGPLAEYYLQMISACEHFIIPNSTFTWWGALLSISPGKIVIAPKKWFNGQSEAVNAIIPKGWLTI